MTGTDDVRDGSILIVCAENVCCSPYIERLMGVRLSKTSIHVSSAGVGTAEESDMDPRIAQRLSELGADPSGFTPRQFTPELAVTADLILCARRAQRTAVVRSDPTVLRRTYALADFCDLSVLLAGTDQPQVMPAERSTESFVRRVSSEAARCRGRAQPRTAEEAEIVDPYRSPDRLLNRMVEQVDRLLGPIVAVLAP